MNKKDYFESLVSLYEAVGMAGTEEVVPQEQIADSGEDVLPQQAAQPEAQEPAPEEETIAEEPVEDTGYLQQAAQPEAPEEASTVLANEKSLKLFNLLDDLLTYGNIFNDSLNSVDINLLDFEILKQYRIYATHVVELIKKIENYIINIFNSETYEKNLYNYILFRTELISIVKELRRVLKLNDPEDKSVLDQKIKK